MKSDYVLGPTLSEFDEMYGTAGSPHAYIYGLHDPRTSDLRYIGKSIRPKERLGNHLHEHSRTHRCHWLDELSTLGLRPVMTVIDAVPANTDWQTIERAYIAAAREDGHHLTNGTDGGDGVAGLAPGPRARITAASRGRKASPETRALMSANRIGRKHTDEWREMMRDKFKGRAFTPEWREKISRGLNKLTDAQVREIRRHLAQGQTQYLIADRFGIHQGTVSNISRGLTYKDVL